jgi:hypothetical protein
VNLTQRNVARAAQIEAELLEDMTDVPPSRSRRRCGRSPTSKAKGIDKVLALTGRANPPPQATDLATLLAGMAAKGYARLNVSLEPAAPAAAPVGEIVEGTAEEEPPA